MLIKTDRHTKADMETWEDWEEIDHLESKKENLARKEYKAIENIRAFTNEHKCYLGVSWGKDSVVVADLALRNKVNISIINLRCMPSHNPECDKVRDAFLLLYPNCNYKEIIVNYGNVYSGNMPDHIRDKYTDKLFYTGFKKACDLYGDSHISGVRAEESGSRNIRMKRWGISTDKTCAPIGWWKTVEVFAYLHKYNLPVHPNYAMLGGGRWDRNRIRVAEIGDVRGNGIGRSEWEKEYYRDILTKIAITH